jgi:hypothetical protein
MQSFLEYMPSAITIIFSLIAPVMAVSESAILAAIAEAVVMVVWARAHLRKLAQLTTQCAARARGQYRWQRAPYTLEFGRVGYYYYSTYYGTIITTLPLRKDEVVGRKR